MAEQEPSKAPPAGVEPAPAAAAEGTGEASAAPPDALEELAQKIIAPALPEGQHFIWGTGRRKTAVARVRIRPGTGQFTVNKRQADEYFRIERDREDIRAPLAAAKMPTSWDVWVNVNGGGFHGQAGAVTLGLARALAKAMPEIESALRAHRLLTRDARMKERKKYGQRGARRRFQFSKR